MILAAFLFAAIAALIVLCVLEAFRSPPPVSPPYRRAAAGSTQARRPAVRAVGPAPISPYDWESETS